MANSTLVPGEYVLQDLFNEFTVQVNRKIDALLLDTHVHVGINFCFIYYIKFKAVSCIEECVICILIFYFLRVSLAIASACIG